MALTPAEQGFARRFRKAACVRCDAKLLRREDGALLIHNAMEISENPLCDVCTGPAVLEVIRPALDRFRPVLLRGWSVRTLPVSTFLSLRTAQHQSVWPDPQHNAAKSQTSRPGR